MHTSSDRSGSTTGAGSPDPSRAGPGHPATLESSSGAATHRALTVAGVPVWIALLVAGVVLGPVYLALPAAARDLLYAGIACLTPIVIAVAIAYYRPRHQVWALVGLGAALMAAGELAWIADAAGLGGGSLADPLFLLG